MKVFIGMETSGRSRRAFAALGHDVISCDYLPQDDEPGVGRHIDGEVFETLAILRSQGWWPDFALFHPSCTYLTYSAEWAYTDGPYHQKVKPGTLVGEARRNMRMHDLAIAQSLVKLPIERIVVENPKGVFDRLSPSFQVIQPYMFGDDASKETHLHLVRVKPLEIPPRSQWVAPRMVNGRPRWANQTDSGQNRVSPGADRWKERSATYPGIANALAANYGQPAAERLAA